jgi:hypothetical protein
MAGERSAQTRATFSAPTAINRIASARLRPFNEPMPRPLLTNTSPNLHARKLLHRRRHGLHGGIAVSIPTVLGACPWIASSTHGAIPASIRMVLRFAIRAILGLLAATLGWGLTFRSVLGVVLTAMIVAALVARISSEGELTAPTFRCRTHAVEVDPGDLLIVLRWLRIWLGVSAVQSCQPNDGPQDVHRNWDRASADISSAGIGRVV